MATPFELPEWARRARPANVRATGSDAPEEYSPLPSTPAGSLYTVRGHAAQYGKGRRTGRTIRGIVLHTTESNSFVSSMIYDHYRPETVSTHAHLGELGELGYIVDEADRSWTTGRWNDEVLNVEIIGRAAWTVEKWRSRPRQISGLADLLEDWCRRHNVPALWLTAAQFAEGASPQGTTPKQGTRRGIVDHLEANRAAILLGGSPSKYSHSDIGPGLRAIVLGEVIPEVARRLADAGPITYTPGGTMLHTVTPKRRLVDTRSGKGAPARRVEAGEILEVEIPKIGDAVPATAIVNVTIVAPSAPGHLQVDGAAFGEASDGNYAPGTPPTPCSTIAAVAGGKIRLRLSGGSAHLIVDLLGAVD